MKRRRIHDFVSKWGLVVVLITGGIGGALLPSRPGGKLYVVGTVLAWGGAAMSAALMIYYVYCFVREIACGERDITDSGGERGPQ